MVDILNGVFKLNIDKKYIDRFTIFIIYISMLFMFIPKYIIEITRSSMGENIFNGIYLVFLIPYLYIFIYNIKNKYHKNSIDFILLTIYLFIVLISTMFSSNIFLSILGSDGRHDGLLTLIMYYLIYISSKSINNKEDVMKIIKIFIIYAIISTVYSIIQVYLPMNMFSYKYYGHMGYGFQGNPNFFGTYMLLFLSLSLFISLFISDSKFYKISNVILFIGLLLSQSSGPFYIFVLLFIFIIIYILIKRKDLIKKVIILLIIFISMYGMVNYSVIYVNKNIYGLEVEEHYTLSGDINIIINYIKDKFHKENYVDIQEEVSNVSDTTSVTVNNELGSSRFIVAKEVIKYILRDNHIWLGSGIDNLNVYYLSAMDDDEIGYWVIDKAHNIYLNIVAETGIFSFIVYISWMIVVLVKGIKSKNKYVYLLLFGLIGYNIQGIFNINVIYVMPYYYILTGMMMGLIEGDRHESRKH